MSKKKFPKSVYVYRGEEGTANEFMAVTTDLVETTEIGEKKKLVGIYHLSEVISVSNSTTMDYPA